MIEIKKREEVAENDKWDLTLMYESLDIWQKDYDDIIILSKKIEDYKDKIMDSSDNLYETLKLSLEIQRKLEHLIIYASMLSDTDTKNSDFQALKGKADNLNQQVSESLSFITPEILKSNYSKIEEYMLEKKELTKYRFLLEQEYRFKKHILDSNSEKMLSSLAQALNSSNETAKYLRNADIKFPVINVDGKDYSITNSNFTLLLKDENRKVREKVFETFYTTYGDLANTLASTYAGEVKANVSLAKIRGYNSAIEAALYNNNIDISIYDNLIKTVNDNMKVIYKYYDMKKNVLNLDKLHLYDTYLPLINGNKKTYKFEEAKKIVLDALKILGDDYVNNLEKAFNERWIDVYPSIGKRTGAYSWGSYDSNPYVLLNYQEEYDDVSTLAHELGHSMHSFYSHKYNDYEYSGYRIFVAEVASTVNELLLSHYMLEKSTDNNEKLYILNELMELYKSTLFRQTMFAEFERDTYALLASGGVLTNENLSNMYYDLNKKYFGDNVIVDSLIKYEWERIPHFFMNFYVYQYATGLSAATYIASSIIENKEGAKDAYLEFLKTGGRDYPLNELKIAGVDLSDKKVVENAIKKFSETIDKFIELKG